MKGGTFASVQQCFLCGKEITNENKSKEHIIPQSIGGRKKVKGFICRECNNDAGQIWDNHLGECFHILGLFLRIVRERKPLPSKIVKTVSGRKLLLNVDGNMTIDRPHISEEQDEKLIKISIQSPSKKEARKLLKGLARKYPEKFDVDQVLSEMNDQPSYLSEPIGMSLSPDLDLIGPSIMKSAVALVYDAGYDSMICNKARDYLAEQTGFPLTANVENELILNRMDGIPYHCVSVSGNPTSGLLIGYVELFGIYRFLINLSDSYSGDAFHQTYTIDPISGSKMNACVNLKFTRSEFLEIMKRPCWGKNNFIEKSLNDILKAAYLRNSKQNQENNIEQAIHRAIKKCGLKAGSEIPLDFNKIIFEELRPWLEHQIKGARPEKREESK